MSTLPPLKSDAFAAGLKRECKGPGQQTIEMEFAVFDAWYLATTLQGYRQFPGRIPRDEKFLDAFERALEAVFPRASNPAAWMTLDQAFKGLEDGPDEEAQMKRCGEELDRAPSPEQTPVRLEFPICELLRFVGMIQLVWRFEDLTEAGRERIRRVAEVMIASVPPTLPYLRAALQAGWEEGNDVPVPSAERRDG